MRYAYAIFILLAVAVLSIFGLRGTPFKSPPVEIFSDMDRQPKYKPQSESGFFVDGRTDRPVPANTVPREGFIEDTHLGTGKTDSGEFASGFPIEVTRGLMVRGRDRYQILCVPCHGALGDGKGITRQYGMLATPTYHDDRLRDMNEGEIFYTITNGKNLMGRYGDKMSAQDRWAIVTYVRALQRAHQGTIDDVPPSNRSELGL